MIEFSSFWNAGLADGVGICGAAGLVFFACFLSFLCRRHILLALAGATYVIAVFWTMVSMGLGLFSGISISDIFFVVAHLVYLAAAVAAFALGAMNFHDWLVLRGFLKNRKQFFCPPAPVNNDKTRDNKFKIVVYCLFVVLLAGATAFIVTMLAGLRAPQPYVTAMIYALSIEQKIWQAVLGMMVYASGYVAPVMAVWIAVFALRQLRQRGIGPTLSQIKVMAAATFWALSAGLFYSVIRN
jgi:hypothetical protein